MEPVASVLTQHAEEAAFLWLLRDQAVERPQYNLRTLTELDERVEAHLDGLRVAGEHGWQAAWAQFEAHPEPGEAFAVAALAFQAADPGRTQQVLERAFASPALVRAAVSAHGWLSGDDALIQSSITGSSLEPSSRLMTVAGSAIQRFHPGPILAKSLRSEDPQLRARAMKAAGELGDTTVLPLVRAGLTAKELDVRFAAAWTVARLTGDPSAAAELQTIAVTESRFLRRAAEMAVRILSPSAARSWIGMLDTLSGCERLAIHTMSAFGDPVAIPQLIERMKTPALARAAGEAFSFITGIHLTNAKLEGAEPEGFEAGPTEDPEDDRVAIDPDDGLAWPDAALAKKWWDANRKQFPPGVRHLSGRPINSEHLKAILKSGYQRQRAAAAIELAIRNSRQPLFEVRAPGWRQASEC